MKLAHLTGALSVVVATLLLAGCGSPKLGYDIRGSEVYYVYLYNDVIPGVMTVERKGETRLDGADASTLQVIEPGSYAKDAQRVFYLGRPLPDADPATFQLLSTDEAYTKDARQVYYLGNAITGADPATFELIGANVYAKDARQVYYTGSVITGADPATFELVGDSEIGRDRQDYYLRVFPLHVHAMAAFTVVGAAGSADAIWAHDTYSYYVGDDVGDDGSIAGFPIADPATFTLLAGGYAKDARKVYYLEQTLSDADPATFALLASGYAKDAARVYHRGYLVSDADAQTFQALGYNYAKDAQHAYSGTTAMDYLDVDLASFQAVGPANVSTPDDGYAKDANRVYYGPGVVPDADAATFVADAEGARDKTRRYYGSTPGEDL